MAVDGKSNKETKDNNNLKTDKVKRSTRNDFKKNKSTQTEINKKNICDKDTKIKKVKNIEKKEEIKEKKTKIKSKVIEQYDYDKDTLYEEADNDNWKFIHRNNIFFLLMIFCVFLIIYLLIPKIKLYGKDNIVISYDSEYVEAGYSAKLFWKDITDKIVISNNILEHKVGSYQVDYVYKFLFFNIKRTRMINIVDKIAPVINIDSEEVKLCPNDEISKIKYTANDGYDGNITDKVAVLEIGNKVTLSVSDSSGNLIEKTINISRIDLDKPVITLSGKSVMYLNYGDKYVEPGYMAMDNCDGDISDKVVVTGEVGSKVGKYQITYTVTDSNNNKTDVIREVIVRDSYLYNDGNINNGTIYLTFDDGPSENTTGYILDVLKEEEVKATFFVTCNGPDYLIKRMYDEGHTVALHTATHNYSYIYSSVNNYFDDLKKVSDRVKRITSLDSKIIRFPGGSSNTISRNYNIGIMTDLTHQVLDKGYRYYDWNVDSKDAFGASSSNQVYYNVVNGLLYNRSNVVLMHDTKYTTKGAIRDIIKYGKSNGYKFDKISMDTYMVRHAVNN